MKCIVIDDEDMSRKSVEHCIKQTDFLSLVQSFSNPVKALSFLTENKVDLIFLDIEMPEMSGMEFIKILEKKAPQIILITSHTKFALEAFEFNVTDYFVKPVSYPRFFKSVTKAKEIFEKESSYDLDSDNIFIKKGSSINRIKKSDILWVEASGDYVLLHTADEKFIIHATMKAIEEKLPAKDYIRVHRSFIVRIDIIDSIEDDLIAYKSKLIPIGKTYKTAVYKRLNMFQ